MEGVLKDIQFSYQPYLLKFKFDAGTSRGVLKEKVSYILKAVSKHNPEVIGWGEAAPLPKLSIDDVRNFEEVLEGTVKKLSGMSVMDSESEVLEWVKTNISENFPSIHFAFETALLDLLHGGKKMIFDTPFFHSEKAMPINGLIWMGDREFMLDQIDKKLAEGYSCIKMKIGAIDFDQECDLLGYIRKRFGAEKVTLRVDANGAFTTKEALEKLKTLHEFDLHSIEQPIKQGQLPEMESLCRLSPLPIALDEELIGIHNLEEKRRLLETIRPQYIILKPTLLGGIGSSREWIGLAESMDIGWWMTSALESNIGLNAIAQFTSIYNIILPQGLGTGQLYHNNIDSPLRIEKGEIKYGIGKWGLEKKLA
ncbi:o-succinylbenzoate synthase [Aquiflexum gelatinilyticum]|uniref:O-succinylbenzoate synthase n=1 Tax=Aquiflexum gelatinilyticum TaxID=2961943 RepID=A0A9X2P9R7_9BACT|nr:o-succinylbenzoate synthase [Aquiflexum gelatinilyticum]MCR9017491.1 o-succinylbenzoate synthase [Aquiflexum gelatinilyticum]